MPRLTSAEIEQFLTEPGHLVRIGTVDADGMPRVAPAWFIFQAGAVLFTPRAQSVFLQNLRRDQRVCLSIDEDALPYRKLTVQGSARLLHDLGDDDVWRETYRAIATRYVSPAAAEAYITSTIDQPRALLSVALAESKVTTWRMPGAHEPGTGIWATRYFLPGTKMRSRIESEQR